jgi:hypothetical protein
MAERKIVVVITAVIVDKIKAGLPDQIIGNLSKHEKIRGLYMK